MEKSDLLYPEYTTEHKMQKMENEPTHEAASSSTDGAKYTEEKGMDIDQIVTELWGERKHNTAMERERKNDKSRECDRDTEIHGA